MERKNSNRKTNILEETPGLRPLSSGVGPSFMVCSNMAIRFRTLIVTVVWKEQLGDNDGTDQGSSKQLCCAAPEVNLRQKIKI